MVLPIKKQDEGYRRELLYLGHLNGIKADLTVLENLRINSALVRRSPFDRGIDGCAGYNRSCMHLKIFQHRNYPKGKSVV